MSTSVFDKSDPPQEGESFALYIARRHHRMIEEIRRGISERGDVILYEDYDSIIYGPAPESESKQACSRLPPECAWEIEETK